jgi:hypothetical protein
MEDNLRSLEVDSKSFGRFKEGPEQKNKKSGARKFDTL